MTACLTVLVNNANNAVVVISASNVTREAIASRVLKNPVPRVNVLNHPNLASNAVRKISVNRILNRRRQYHRRFLAVRKNLNRAVEV